MRIRPIAATLLMVAVACSGSTTGSTPTPTQQRSAARTHSPRPRPTETVRPSATPSVVPSGIPSGTPASFPQDVPATQLRPQALVPDGVTVTDAWSTMTSAGETAGVAYVEPGDPLRSRRGLIIWRRSPGEVPPWRPALGITTPASAGVLQMETLLGEATGDGSDDALLFEGTGGSGACGTTILVDLAANAQVYRKTSCDTVVGFSPKPVGLSVRQAVYAPTDSHCCPSSFRTTVLTYSGTKWVVESSTTTPT